MAGPATVTVQLKEPIAFGSELVTVFVIRRPKAKDFRRLPAAPAFGDILDMAGQLAGQPKAVVDELGVEDLQEVIRIVGDFMPAGRETGGTPSP